MTFDTPQWPFRAAEQIENYGPARGVVTIYPERGKQKEVAVVVPTVFFQFLLGVLSPETQALVEKNGIQFYLDDLGGGRWAFGFSYGTDEVYDLWVHTRSNMPPWFHKAMP